MQAVAAVAEKVLLFDNRPINNVMMKPPDLSGGFFLKMCSSIYWISSEGGAGAFGGFGGAGGAGGAGAFFPTRYFL